MPPVLFMHALNASLVSEYPDTARAMSMSRPALLLVCGLALAAAAATCGDAKNMKSMAGGLLRRY